MRLLMLHADHFEYAVTGETSVSKALDPIDTSLMQGACDEALVCLIAVEKGDADRLPGLVANATREIGEHCKQVHAARVMLYPYAHLSASLESPRAAVKVLDALAVSLRQSDGLEVSHAPFGVYKGFQIKVKGHPLSEHGRTISAQATEDAGASSAIKAENVKKSEWFVITPQGETVPLADFNTDGHEDLKKFIAYEMGGTRVCEDAPPHIRLMQEHELADYEPGSDAGNFRWYPKGYLFKRLLEDQASKMVTDYGGMQVETPIMYDFNHPALAKYLDKFPARQYVVKSEKGEYFLRFAACFGQYLIKHDMAITYKHLPLSLYELTHYSFRREQSGELAGMRRLRTFTMPDMHTLCADVHQAKTEMLKLVDLSLQWMDDLNYRYAVAVRAVRDFYDEGPEYAREIAKRSGKPVLLELWDKRYFYFVTKFELNVVDSQDKAAALSTVQIDVENPGGFGIHYVDSSGDDQTPLMLHTSVSGSIDRNLYALLEQQAMKMSKGEKGHFPFWLSPTQLRLIPVKDAHIEACQALASRLQGRVDIDDRDESLGKRIRWAEKEWIPLTIAIGDREAASDTLPVRVRGEAKERAMSIDEINAHVAQQLQGKAYRPLNLPRMLSKRPIFRG